MIYYAETFEQSTIRSGTPMFLLARKIKAHGIKMIMSGEGSDEIFGGYMYFHKAPNKEELHQETVRKVSRLHKYDNLRANKATMAWGLELRVPFLDREFMDYAMDIDPISKMCGIQEGKQVIEKKLLRMAFDTPEDPYLPNDILWRQKEQFQDGVGYGWVDAIKDLAEKTVTDIKFKNSKNRFPIKTPMNKEQFMFREIFNK